MRSDWLFADFPLFQSQNTQLDPEEDLCRGCLNGIHLPLCAYCIHYMQTSAPVSNADNDACFMFLLRIGPELQVRSLQKRSSAVDVLSLNQGLNIIAKAVFYWSNAAYLC